MNPPKLIIAPTVEPISLDDLRFSLRIDELSDPTENAAQDKRLTMLLKAARQSCESLAGKTWNETMWEWIYHRDYNEARHWYGTRHRITLPRATPLIEIVSVYYEDSSHVEHLLHSAYYSGDVDSEPGQLVLTSEHPADWSSHRLRIRYRAGTELTSPITPQPEVRPLVALMLATHLWQNPEPAATSGISGVALTPVMERTIVGMLTLSNDRLPSDC